MCGVCRYVESLTKFKLVYTDTAVEARESNYCKAILDQCRTTSLESCTSSNKRLAHKQGVFLLRVTPTLLVCTAAYAAHSILHVPQHIIDEKPKVA